MQEKDRQVKTIVVRCPNWVGDVVMAIPMLDCLRSQYPGVRMVGIAKRNAQGILRDGPWFDEFIDSEDKRWGGFWRMVRRIRGLEAEMGLVLPNSIRSVLPLWLGKVKAIYGYRRNLRGIFQRGGPRPRREKGRIVPLPMREYYLGLCRWLGFEEGAVTSPRLYIGAALQRRGDELLRKYGIEAGDRVIGLNPGASFGSSKCWPPEYFAVLAARCEGELGAKVMLLCGPGEEAIVKAIVHQSKAAVINTAPDKVDLELLKPLVARCNLLITNDTGPRHYAVGLGVPVVVIMGPTDPRWTQSDLEQTIVIRAEGVSCSPCHKKVCPADHRCMREITPEEVFEAGKRLWKDRA